MKDWATKGLINDGETFCMSPTYVCRLAFARALSPRHVHTEVLKGKSTCEEAVAAGSAGFVSTPQLFIDHFREGSASHVRAQVEMDCSL